MSDCCDVPNKEKDQRGSLTCPACGQPGRPVKLTTVKSLLCSEALARLDAGVEWRFCPSPDCETVYFSGGMVYRRAEVRVPVFQKEHGEDVPVCYCFGWTWRRIKEEIARTGRCTAVESITAHVRAGRCACELRNPQGQCCLANVRSAVTREGRSC